MPGRLAEVTVEEGSSVTKGQVIAKLTSPEYEAQLRAAKANVKKANDALAAAEAEIASRQSALEFAKSDFQRGQELIKSGHITKQTFEQRKRNLDSAVAAVQSFTSQRDQALSQIANSEAEVDRIQSIIDDLTLVSPRLGRVQYQLARAGEVVAAGAPIVTILDLTDVYMTVFLPAADAGKLAVGDEARIILDPVPDYVIPASVSFVAADAQFTPKTVETTDERAKLMFRVKLKVDQQVLQAFYTRVKTGVRGPGLRPHQGRFGVASRASGQAAQAAGGQSLCNTGCRQRPAPGDRARSQDPRQQRGRNQDARRQMTGEPIARVKGVSHRYGATVVAGRCLHRHSVAHHGGRDRAGRRRQVDFARAHRRRQEDSSRRGRRLRQERRKPSNLKATFAAASPICRKA